MKSLSGLGFKKCKADEKGRKFRREVKCNCSLKTKKTVLREKYNIKGGSFMASKALQLTIGIPVRNEEKTFKKFICSLQAAVELLDKKIAIETIVCLNGSSDNSEQIIDDLIEGPVISKIKLQKIYSAEGKINALNAIIKARRFSGFICFFDADTLLNENCLIALWSAPLSSVIISFRFLPNRPLCLMSFNKFCRDS